MKIGRLTKFSKYLEKSIMGAKQMASIVKDRPFALMELPNVFPRVRLEDPRRDAIWEYYDTGKGFFPVLRYTDRYRNSIEKKLYANKTRNPETLPVTAKDLALHEHSGAYWASVMAVFEIDYAVACALFKPGHFSSARNLPEWGREFTPLLGDNLKYSTINYNIMELLKWYRDGGDELKRMVSAAYVKDENGNVQPRKK